MSFGAAYVCVWRLCIGRNLMHPYNQMIFNECCSLPTAISCRAVGMEFASRKQPLEDAGSSKCKTAMRHICGRFIQIGITS